MEKILKTVTGYWLKKDLLINADPDNEEHEEEQDELKIGKQSKTADTEVDKQDNEPEKDLLNDYCKNKDVDTGEQTKQTNDDDGDVAIKPKDGMKEELIETDHLFYDKQDAHDSQDYIPLIDNSDDNKEEEIPGVDEEESYRKTPEENWDELTFIPIKIDDDEPDFCWFGETFTVYDEGLMSVPQSSRNIYKMLSVGTLGAKIGMGCYLLNHVTGMFENFKNGEYFGFADYVLNGSIFTPRE